jgi:hypothetical protein
MSEKHSFWVTLPGILTGVASLITAIVALMTFMSHKNESKAPTMNAPVAMNIPAPERPNGCKEAIGTWSWFIGGTVTFTSNGVLSWKKNASDNLPTALGSWKCVDDKSKTMTLHWPTGLADTVSLSPDRKSISGSNELGVQISGTKL